MNDHSLVENINAKSVYRKILSVVLQIMRICNNGWKSPLYKVIAQNPELARCRYVIPIDNCDLRWFFFATPLTISRDQRSKQRLMRLRQPIIIHVQKSLQGW